MRRIQTRILCVLLPMVFTVLFSSATTAAAYEPTRLTLTLEGGAGGFILSGGDGAIWRAVPNDAAENPDLRGAVKNRLLSVVAGTVLDTALGKETAFHTHTLAAEGKAEYIRLANGFEVRFHIDGGLRFTLRVLLRDGFLSVSIPGDSIQETERLVFREIQLLPGFGAGGAIDEGFILIPDGSGALIHFNNGRKGIYNEPVYGGDKAYIREAVPLSKADVALPVYGIQRNGRAFLAVLHSGAERARITASAAGNGTPYNTAYPVYTLRGRDTQRIIVGVEQTVYEDTRLFNGDIELRIYPVAGKDTGYVGMARALERYLKDEMGIDAPDAAEADTVLSVYGGVSRRARLLGVPLWNEAAPVTTFAQAQAIMDEFIRFPGDVKPLLELREWDENQILGRAAQKPKPARALGGVSGLKRLLNRCTEIGVTVYGGVRAAGFSKGSTSGAVRTIGGEPSAQFAYFRSSYAADVSRRFWLLKPQAMIGNQEWFGTLAASYGFSGTAFTDVGGLVYGDYDPRTPAAAGYVTDAFQTVLRKVGEQGEVMISGGFMYALGEAGTVINAPVTASGFSYCDGAVPFYQIALSGMRRYAGPAINGMANRRDALLFALETGSLLHWDIVTAEDMTALKGTSLEHLGGASYALNKDFIKDASGEFAPLIRKTAGVRIIGHTVLERGVVRTVFENGTQVTVNYNQAERAGVPAKGYVIK